MGKPGSLKKLCSLRKTQGGNEAQQKPFDGDQNLHLPKRPIPKLECSKSIAGERGESDGVSVIIHTVNTSLFQEDSPSFFVAQLNRSRGKNFGVGKLKMVVFIKLNCLKKTLATSCQYRLNQKIVFVNKLKPG